VRFFFQEQQLWAFLINRVPAIRYIFVFFEKKTKDAAAIGVKEPQWSLLTINHN